MRRIIERVNALYENDNKSPERFVDYGWPVLNKALLGLDQGVVLLTAPPNVGKCLAEGTLLTMPDGTLRRIESIGDDEVVSLDTDTLKMVRACTRGAIYSGEKECFRVRTSLGHEIVATKNHPFLTLEGWTELKDFDEGSHVAVARRIPVFGTDVAWDRIVSIEHVGVMPVYDIEVPATRNFVANNFIVHNSTLLMNLSSCLYRALYLFWGESESISHLFPLSHVRHVDFGLLGAPDVVMVYHWRPEHLRDPDGGKLRLRLALADPDRPLPCLAYLAVVPVPVVAFAHRAVRARLEVRAP